jgi:methionine-rich copper-binding protein CopC
VRAAGRLVAAGFLALAAVLVLAAPGSAHDRLVATDPAAGSKVSSVPTAVSLTFNEPVLGVGSRVEVIGPDGDVVAGRPKVVDTVVKVAVRDAAPAGKYTVKWRVTSADGHPISGTFTFRAAEPAGTPPGTPSPAPGGEAVATPSAAPATVPPTALPAQSAAGTDGGLSGLAVTGIGVVVLLLVMALGVLIRRMRST